jgi:hypothetical protein
MAEGFQQSIPHTELSTRRTTWRWNADNPMSSRIPANVARLKTFVFVMRTSTDLSPVAYMLLQFGISSGELP